MSKENTSMNDNKSHTFEIKAYCVKANITISEPIYPQDLEEIAKEIRLFHEYFWNNEYETWIGICYGTIDQYIADFEEDHQYIKNIEKIE